MHAYLREPQAFGGGGALLIILTVIVSIAGWLALWAVLAARTSCAAGAEGPPQAAGPEPPAVVSLLAGRLESTGYPATLLAAHHDR